MEKRKLGNTDLYLSEFGFGCASAWGKSFYDEKKAIQLFFEAYNAGINYYDTGHSYGLAEERLGKCISELGKNNRENLIISTKCGTRLGDNGKYCKDWSVDWLKKSLEISLERLNVDYVDMLNLHSPTLMDIPDEVWYLLEDFKKQKLVRTVGASCMSLSDNNRAAEESAFDFVMISYNLLRQEHEDVIEKLYKSGKGVIAGSPLARTLYSNDVFKVRSIKDVWYLVRALTKRRGDLIKGRRYQFINRVENATGNQIALRYVLDNPYITSAVFGTTSKEHLLQNIQAANIEIPSEIMERIKHT